MNVPAPPTCAVAVPLWGYPVACLLGLSPANIRRLVAHVGVPVTNITVRFTFGVNVTGLAWEGGEIEITAGIFATRTRAEWAVLHELTHQQGLWGHGRFFRAALLDHARTWFRRPLPSSLARLRGTDYAFDRAAVTLLENP